jgi:hypothetical protein
MMVLEVLVDDHPEVLLAQRDHAAETPPEIQVAARVGACSGTHAPRRSGVAAN